MEESYTTRRVVIVGGSLLALYFVNFLAGLVGPAVQPPVDAAAGFAIGIAVRHYWS